MTTLTPIQALIRSAEARACAPARRGKPVAISSRWKPGHVIRIDTERGSFEEINAPLLSSAEIDVQTALLSSTKKPTGYPWQWWACVIACGLATLAINRWAPAA